MHASCNYDCCSGIWSFADQTEVHDRRGDETDAGRNETSWNLQKTEINVIFEKYRIGTESRYCFQGGMIL